MSKRSAQPAILLIILLLAALGGWACGGGEEETLTTQAPSGSVTTAVLGGGTADLIGSQLRTTSSTPAEYVDAVKEGRPIAILFYVPAGVDDQKVLESFSTLQANFPEIVFLTYDFSQPDAYGDLSILLQVDYPPAVILVDETGTVDAVWNGYVDEGTLNQELVNLGV